MDKQYKKEITPIPAEKMIVIARKGLDAVSLSKEEKEYLLHGGLEELQGLCEMMEEPLTPLSDEEVERVRSAFYAAQTELPKAAEAIQKNIRSIWVRVKDGAIELIESLTSGFEIGTPAFAHRGKGEQEVTWCERVGDAAVYCKLQPVEDDCLDLSVRIDYPQEKKNRRIGVALYQGDRRVAGANALADDNCIIRRIHRGEYTCRISSEEGDIVSFPLGIKA